MGYVAVLERMASTKRSKSETEELKWRALAAFVKYAQPGDLRVPSEQTKAAIVEIRGLHYITLTAGTKRLAIYRVRADGQLRRMRRPPRELRGPDDE